MATANRAGRKSGAICNSARSSIPPASANAQSTNTARRNRPTTILPEQSMRPGNTCRSPSSGRRAANQKPHLAGRFLEARPPLLAVAAKRVLDDRVRLACGLNLVYFHALALQLFVVLEKTPQHERPVGRHLGGFAVRVELRIF